ncbi:UPF0236 family transposase-like protein [Garciella nitratireducens]
MKLLQFLSFPLSTIFGVVNYKRTYYKNKKTKEYAYLSDETY